MPPHQKLFAEQQNSRMIGKTEMYPYSPQSRMNRLNILPNALPGNPAMLIANAITQPIKLKQIVNSNRTNSFPENCLYEIGIVDIFFIVSSVYSLVMITRNQ